MTWSHGRKQVFGVSFHRNEFGSLRSVPVFAPMSKISTLHYDAVVCGGGSSGSAAAIAIARRGHKVLLLEESNCLGGISTAGGVNEWYASLDGMGDLFDQVKSAMAGYGAKFGRFFNSEYLKIVWQEMADQAGVDVLFHAQVYDAIAQNGKVNALRFASCSQIFEVNAAYFLDCSGEGDLSYLAGAQYMKGDADGKNIMHLTLTFLLYNTGKKVTISLPPSISRIEDESELPGLQSCFKLPDDRVYCNMTKVIGIDPTDPFELSRAEMQARRQVLQIAEFLQRTRYPNYTLCSTGARIGIREGRRVVCDYTLTEKDILKGDFRRECRDGIAVATCHIDHLDPTAQGGGGRREGVQPYPIPLRCLVVKDFSNLLVAGKCISGEQAALASYRMIPTCCAMGQAAGTDVALALEQKKSNIRDVDLTSLQQVLESNGMLLAPEKHKAFHGWSKADSGIHKYHDDA